VEEGRLQLISDVIKSCLGVDCAVLMGANIASGVAKQQFCEATIGQSVITQCTQHTRGFAIMRCIHLLLTLTYV